MTAAPRVEESQQELEQDIDLSRVLQALSRRRRLALAVLLASLLTGAGITAWQRAFRPIFEGTFKLLVSDPINAGSDRGDRGGLEDVALSGKVSTNTPLLIQVLSSPLLLAPVERALNLAPGSLESAVTVSPTKGADGVLEVGLRWRDPAQGAAILRELSRTMLVYSLRQRQEKLTQGLAFLDQQAPELQERVNRLQTRLADFREANAFVAPEEQATSLLMQRQELAGKLLALQQQQARLEGQLAAVRRGELGKVPVTGPREPGKGDNSTVDTAAPLTGLNEVEDALAQARANFTEAAPQVRDLREQRARLRPVLQRRQEDELRAQLSQNLAEQREIGRQRKGISGRFRATPIQIKQYEAIEQQLKVARENLSSYIKARESFRLQVAQRTVPWSVLAPPRFSARPVQPSVPRNLALSLLFGLLGGAGVALLRDRLDPVFHHPNELKEALPLPLLGVVPHLPDAASFTVAKAVEAMDGAQRFALKESLRNLFANFRLLRADKTVRLVALTSATQGEGKSTTAALFALTLVELGQRVLLVDADMRRPMLHRYLGSENGPGLSTLLTDGGLDPLLCLTPLRPGLDLLPAGPNPPDTTQLLSSERCGEVVSAIRRLPGYDLVLFDTPPAFLLSDPVLLASHLDGLLLVVGMERVNRDLPAEALERMRGTGVDVLGVLANLPLRHRSSPQGYGYGYRYGYGYGYGGYQDLASRYDGPGESGQEGRDLAKADSRSVIRPRSKPMAAGIRKVARWLDRRD